MLIYPEVICLQNFSIVESPDPFGAGTYNFQSISAMWRNRVWLRETISPVSGNHPETRSYPSTVTLHVVSRDSGIQAVTGISQDIPRWMLWALLRILGFDLNSEYNYLQDSEIPAAQVLYARVTRLL